METYRTTMQYRSHFRYNYIFHRKSVSLVEAFRLERELIAPLCARARTVRLSRCNGSIAMTVAVRYYAVAIRHGEKDNRIPISRRGRGATLRWRRYRSPTIPILRQHRSGTANLNPRGLSPTVRTRSVPLAIPSKVHAPPQSEDVSFFSIVPCRLLSHAFRRAVIIYILAKHRWVNSYGGALRTLQTGTWWIYGGQ